MAAHRITAVPAHADDLIRRGSVNGFTVTEAWSPPRPIPAHAHASLSITVLIGGGFEECYRPVNRPGPRAYPCEPGTLLVRPPGEVHENHLGRQGARTLSLELSPERLELCGKALAPIQRIGARREAAFLDIGLAMSRELRMADAASPLALESLSLELLARLMRIGAGGSRCTEDEENAVPEWLARARTTIHDRFREQSLRVGDLAAEQGVHPVYFARVFRHHFQTTPGGYVRRLRLEWAISRVLETAESLSSIALDCGFADQSHLTRAVRARYGLSPGALRRTRSS